MKVRLHKYIANCGYCSRRHAELLIQAGLVEVNGQKIEEMGLQINPDKDKVTINGDSIEQPPKLTIMLHKPTNFITSTNDTHERLTVMDLLPKRMRDWGVFPVGRLDFETEGLLILTNDGELSHKLAHPSFECEKEYFVRAKGDLNRKHFDRLTNGSIVVENSKVKPAVVSNINKSNGDTEFHIIIKEGKKRQIRMMVKEVGSEVKYLKRIRMSDLLLGDLPRGKYKELTPNDLKKLH